MICFYFSRTTTTFSVYFEQNNAAFLKRVGLGGRKMKAYFHIIKYNRYIYFPKRQHRQTTTNQPPFNGALMAPIGL